MYNLKQVPEDFVVDEVSETSLSEAGSYTIAILKKRDWTTINACKMIAMSLGVKVNYIGFAGVKDRRAVTSQKISIKKPHKSVSSVKKDGIYLEEIGFSKNPVSLGDLKGNNFSIVIRNINGVPEKVYQSINYFDDQRFSKNNHLVGKKIIKREFDKACQFLKKEKSVADHLLKNPNDFIGAIKKIPLKTRMFYVHAYQSWLFNRTVLEYVKKFDCVSSEYSLGLLLFPKGEVENEIIPIIGFGMEQPKNETIAKIIKNIMKEEKITERDFVIRQIPEMSCEGTKRSMVVDVQRINMGILEDDELNIGMKKCRVSFFLEKGNYATMVIKRMFAS